MAANVGPLVFARYAYPPNALGYCGQDDHLALLEYGASSTVDDGLIRLLHSFHGAMPYLRQIGAATGADPLDRAVVEAYWVGNPLVERVAKRDLNEEVMARFGGGLGTQAGDVSNLVMTAGVPHHNFHVFCVYPWLGLLRAGWSEHPVHVMDRCRIRWGTVVDLVADEAVVKTNLLTWDGDRLSLGPDVVEMAYWRRGGYAQVAPKPGDQVSLHWNWVCDVLRPASQRTLHSITRRILGSVNDVLATAEVRAPAALS